MWTLIIIVFGLNFSTVNWIPGFIDEQECLHAKRSLFEIVGNNANAVCVQRTGK